MPSVMTLDGARGYGIGNPVGEFILRQPLPVMAALTLGLAGVVGFAVSYPVVLGVERFKGGRKALRGLYGPPSLPRKRRRRR